MQAFFHQPAASMPSLTTTVDCPTTLENHEKFLWELLETYMGPRSCMFDVPMSPVLLEHSRVIADLARGVDITASINSNKRIYQEVRNEYWRLCPQRPYNVEDPSPWVKEGRDDADDRGQVEALEEMSPSEIIGPLLHLDVARMLLAPRVQWKLFRGGDPHDLVAIV